MKDTIVALATAPGISSIAVVRLSGAEALSIVDRCFTGKQKISDAPTHTIHYGSFYNKDILLDKVTVSVFRQPNSYTGEDVVEISCHGGSLISSEIINTLIAEGARLAEPGEFTKRAFLNGKMDLAQVEAVADLIHSQSIKGVKTAIRQIKGEFTNRLNTFRKQLLDIASLLELELDFADEEIEITNPEQIEEKLVSAIKLCDELHSSFRASEILRSGYYIAIAGYPNAGKSTLFNTLLQRKRAIVSEAPGTTRDYLEEPLILGEVTVKLIDTAGIRESEDLIEIEGIKFAESVLEQSDMALIINDASKSLDYSDNLLKALQKIFPHLKTILIQNKIDLLGENANVIIQSNNAKVLHISAKKKIGIEDLKNTIQREAISSSDRVSDILVNQRQALLLKEALSYLDAALTSLKAKLGNEIIAIDVRKSAEKLGEMTGERWSEDVLNNIFSKFCIGK
jgi:tRNA modification GTPase